MAINYQETYLDTDDVDTLVLPVEGRHATRPRTRANTSHPLKYMASFAAGVVCAGLLINTVQDRPAAESSQGVTADAAPTPTATPQEETEPAPTPRDDAVASAGPQADTSPKTSASPEAPRAAGDLPQLFSADSYWNTPLDANGPAPVHKQNAAFVADSEANSPKGLMLNVEGGYGQPVFFASPEDPVYTLDTPNGPLEVHIPDDAKPATGSDGQLVVFDETPGFNRVVGLHKASFQGGKWSVAGKVDNWQLDSNGLAAEYGGHELNGGHRGVPALARSVLQEELTVGIDRRLECFWHATADGHHFPMTGAESGKGGVVPEGVVARISADTDLDAYDLSPAGRIVAEGLQEYGCVIGDNSGSGNRLKIQVTGGDAASLVAANALSQIPWDAYEFVEGGYDPTTGKIRQ